MTEWLRRPEDLDRREPALRHILLRQLKSLEADDRCDRLMAVLPETSDGSRSILFSIATLEEQPFHQECATRWVEFQRSQKRTWRPAKTGPFRITKTWKPRPGKPTPPHTLQGYVSYLVHYFLALDGQPCHDDGLTSELRAKWPAPAGDAELSAYEHFRIHKNDPGYLAPPRFQHLMHLKSCAIDHANHIRRTVHHFYEDLWDTDTAKFHAPWHVVKVGPDRSRRWATVKEIEAARELAPADDRWQEVIDLTATGIDRIVGYGLLRDDVAWSPEGYFLAKGPKGWLSFPSTCQHLARRIGDMLDAGDEGPILPSTRRDAAGQAITGTEVCNLFRSKGAKITADDVGNHGIAQMLVIDFNETYVRRASHHTKRFIDNLKVDARAAWKRDPAMFRTADQLAAATKAAYRQCGHCELVQVPDVRMRCQRCGHSLADGALSGLGELVLQLHSLKERHLAATNRSHAEESRRLLAHLGLDTEDKHAAS